MHILLSRYAVLRFTGADRSAFLQGQLTQDVAAVKPGHAALTGWASAKGRLLATGQLIATEDAIYLPLPVDISEFTAKRLNMFVLRSKVEIDVADLSVYGFGDETMPEERLCSAPLIGDPARTLSIGPHDASVPEDSSAWTLANIRAGLPEIHTETSEAFVPQMVNLDLLGGISFTKGCYVGQEVVARLHNLGRVKRRMLRFRAEASAPLSAGQAVFGPGSASGTVVMSAPDHAAAELLAVIPIAQADDDWFADEERTKPLLPEPLPYPI